MTKGELLQILEEFDDDVEVRMAVQPSWPFEHSLHGAFSVVDENDCYDNDDDSPRVVYLAVGEQLGYLNQEITDELTSQGWTR